MRSHVFFVFLLQLLSISANAQQYKNLVLKGGGIRGIAYCGALQVMEQKNISQGIERVAGTSAGAIVGVLFSVGYSAKEVEEIMFSLEVKSFNDGAWFFIGGQKRMRNKYGWYKGKKLEAWLGDAISKKTGSTTTTFKQLHELRQKDPRYKDIFVTATNLSQQRLEVFNWKTYPDMPVKTAVRASASVPLYYQAAFMDSAGHVTKPNVDSTRYSIYADGGLLANYPIALFNEKDETGINPNTLGLKLDRPEQIAWYPNHKGVAPYPIHSFKKYVGALYNVTIERLGQSLPYEVEKKNTIYISNGNMSPRVRHITTEQKKALFENGRMAAEAFFDGRL